MVHASRILRCVRNGDTVGIKHPRAAVGAGSKMIRLVETVILLLARHRGILHLQAAHMPHNGMYAPPTGQATPNRDHLLIISIKFQ